MLFQPLVLLEGHAGVLLHPLGVLEEWQLPLLIQDKAWLGVLEASVLLQPLEGHAWVLLQLPTLPPATLALE